MPKKSSLLDDLITLPWWFSIILAPLSMRSSNTDCQLTSFIARYSEASPLLFQTWQVSTAPKLFTEVAS